MTRKKMINKLGKFLRRTGLDHLLAHEAAKFLADNGFNSYAGSENPPGLVVVADVWESSCCGYPYTCTTQEYELLGYSGPTGSVSLEECKKSLGMN
jgi:hypothetical protein